MRSPSIAGETLGFSSELANDSSQRCILAQRQWPKYKERVEVSKVFLQYKHFEGLRRFCKSGWLLEALWTADVLYQQGIALSVDLLYRLLQLSIDKKDLAAGTEVHGLVKRSGLYANAFLSSHLIRMFSVCGSLWEANQVFQELAEPTVFTWSAVITAHAMHGYSEHGIELYHRMQQSGIKPDEHVFVAVLKACASTAAEKEGKQIHMHIKESGFGFDNFVGSTLISMYVKCGNLVDARRVFEQLPDKNLVTWNAILTGYAQDKHGHEAFRLFQHLQQEGMQPDSVTVVSILKACSSIEALNQGKVMHMYAIEIGLLYDLFVCCALIDMYAKCGSLEIAHTLFSNLSKRNVVVWNALITGYSQHGCNQEAFQLFNSMQQEGMQPDNVTFSGILKACASIEGLHQGKLIHVLLNESGYKVDIVVCNALIGMYAKCGSLKSSLWEFNKLVNKNLVSWNTIIAAYAEHGHGQETLLLLRQMEQEGVEPDSVTFLSILKVCSSKTSVGLGKLIHSLVARSGLHLDLSVCNALIHMYANYASIRDARSVFESMPQLNRVTWNAMLAAYAQTGYSQKALQLYLLMHQEGMMPDGVTCVSILRACTTITAIGHGKVIHSFIIERGFDSDKFVGSTLIDLYLKCGNFHDANKLFDKWLKQDLVAWNAMIAGHAYYGLYKLALQYFEDMQNKGLKPDNVTFVCVLSACSQLGIAEEGRQYFDMLIDNRSVSPRAEHYHCIADLLGRAGRLREAVDLLQTMPSFGPQILAWKSLLSHCRTHGNIQLGRKCFAHVIKKNCKDAAGYMLMSSIYFDLGMLKNVSNVEELKKCERP